MFIINYELKGHTNLHNGDIRIKFNVLFGF